MTRVTHPDRPGEVGVIVSSKKAAWTPDEALHEAPLRGMVKVRWSGGIHPSELYWEFEKELTVIEA